MVFYQPWNGARALATLVPAVALVVLLLGRDAGHVDGTLRNVEGVLVVEVVSQVTEAPDLPAAPGVQLVGMVYLQDLTQVGNDVLERL